MTIEQSDTWFWDAELYIFDLDGTLYEDTDHFDYFASLLQQNLPAHKQQEFTDEYRQMKAGKHTVKIGKAYDVGQDAVLTIDPVTEKITAVQDWDGQQWPKEKIQRIYPTPLRYDFNSMIAIGDGWWPPHITARHYGLDPETVQACYNKTKEYIASDAFQLTKTPGLKEGLIHLGKEKNLVLLTNSEADDVKRLLKEIDLENIFDEIVPMAMKPARTKEHFHGLMARYQIKPEDTVSIGDNFINEIAPALLLAMKAVYIQPHQQEEIRDNLCIVHSLTDLFES